MFLKGFFKFFEIKFIFWNNAFNQSFFNEFMGVFKTLPLKGGIKKTKAFLDSSFSFLKQDPTQMMSPFSTFFLPPFFLWSKLPVSTSKILTEVLF